MPIQTDVTLVLAHADRSHSETAHLHLPLCRRHPAQAGAVLGYTAPLRPPQLLAGAPPGEHWAQWCDPRVGGSYLRGRAALRARAARGERRGGQPRGSQLARSGSGRSGRRQKEEEKGRERGGQRGAEERAEGGAWAEPSAARPAGERAAALIRAPQPGLSPPHYLPFFCQPLSPSSQSCRTPGRRWHIWDKLWG